METSTSGSTEQRIFKIDVGKMPEEDVDEFIQRVVAKFKKRNIEFPKDIKIPDFDITYASEYKRKEEK